ncbi:cyclomaltodextrinase N-terminal domain-containing protein [Luteimonas sp. SDU101]|uniref:cyclomaltodextrinase N-terminal domain-containing protein n=1 Tax=Luteimonas sp. SDU101 TaxID=3422593 RepID=UPI003EB73364
MHREVELMLHGQDIAGPQARIAHPGARVTGVQALENPGFLFVGVHIDGNVTPGALEIELLDGDTVAGRHSWRDAREPAPPRGFDGRDSIYWSRATPSPTATPATTACRACASAPTAPIRTAAMAGTCPACAPTGYTGSLGFSRLWPTPLLKNDQPGLSCHDHAITTCTASTRAWAAIQDERALAREARTASASAAW